VALKGTDCPAQMARSIPAFAVTELTVTTTVSVSVQFPLEVVNMYVVFWIGFAIGLAILALLKPIAGDQENVVPPCPFKVTEPPAQILASWPAFAVTPGITVTTTWSVEIHLKLLLYKL
jgi:hypothetical protein